MGVRAQGSSPVWTEDSPASLATSVHLQQEKLPGPSPRFLPASIPCDDQLPHRDGGRDKSKGRTALLGPRPSAGGASEGGPFRSAQVLCGHRKPPWAQLFLGSPRPWSRVVLTGNPQGGVRFPSPRPSAPSFMSQSPQPSSGAESLSSQHKPGPRTQAGCRAFPQKNAVGLSYTFQQ